MVKSYFLLYQAAKKLYDQEKIQLESIKEEENRTLYYFKANDHTTTLEISKLSAKGLWLRHWSCDCEHYSLWQDKSECKHIKAAELYLMSGGYANKN